MSAEWFYLKNDRQHGPISEAELRELLAKGQLTRTDHARQGTTAQWTPLEALDAMAVAPALPPVAALKIDPPVAALKIDPPVAAFAAVPVAPTAPVKSGVLMGLIRPFLSQEQREGLQEFAASWSQLNIVARAGILFLGVVVLAVVVWRAFSGGGGGNSLWDRIWESGVVSGLVAFTFAYFRKKLIEKETVSVAASASAVPPPLPTPKSEQFLELGGRQWLAVIMALFLPILLASLLTSFLMGPEVHLWLTGPLLVVLGITAALLSIRVSSADEGPIKVLGSLIGFSIPFIYLLTCLNVRWVVMFYTLLITLPALELFRVTRRGAEQIHFIPTLKLGIGILGLVLFLGFLMLPRGANAIAGGKDASSKLVGVWTKSGNSSTPETLRFTQGGTISYGHYRDAQAVAKFTFDGSTLTITDDNRTMTYPAELVSGRELLLGKGKAGFGSYFDGFTDLTGRWTGGDSGGDIGSKSSLLPAPPGSDGSKSKFEDNGSPRSSNLDSPLAPKLIGRWQGATGKAVDVTVEFTKAGKAMIQYPETNRTASMKTVLGSYTFVKEAELRIDPAGSYATKSRVEIEFLKDDELLFVNHSNSYSDFGPLAGRFKRAK